MADLGGIRYAKAAESPPATDVGRWVPTKRPVPQTRGDKLARSSCERPREERRIAVAGRESAIGRDGRLCGAGFGHGSRNCLGRGRGNATFETIFLVGNRDRHHCGLEHRPCGNRMELRIGHGWRRACGCPRAGRTGEDGCSQRIPQWVARRLPAEFRGMTVRASSIEFDGPVAAQEVAVARSEVAATRCEREDRGAAEDARKSPHEIELSS